MASNLQGAQPVLKSYWGPILQSSFPMMMVATWESNIHRCNLGNPSVIPDAFYAYVYEIHIPDAHRLDKSCAK